jgi:hypothetical protein
MYIFLPGIVVIAEDWGWLPYTDSVVPSDWAFMLGGVHD